MGGGAAVGNPQGGNQLPVSPSPPQVKHLNWPFQPVPLHCVHLYPAYAAPAVNAMARTVSVIFFMMILALLLVSYFRASRVIEPATVLTPPPLEPSEQHSIREAG